MKKSCLLAASIAAALPLSVQAQNSSKETALEEVMVTAQRRTESLQNVPISISAFTAADLEKTNATSAKDYLQFSPNVTFTEDGEVGNRGLNLSIRGVSNVSLGEVSVQNSIGYYVDEVSVGSVASGAFNPQLEDMERIEVLRGPQGTYFGRNALGGALNLTTKKPTEDFYASASANVGRYSTWGASGVVNVPFSDTFFMRAVAAYDESDGIIENVNPSGAENSGYEYTHGRVAFRALPSDALALDLSVSYTKEDEGLDATVASGVLDLDTKSIFGDGFVPIDNQLGFYPRNQRKVNHDAPEYNRNKITIVNARVAYQFDGFELRSVTGYIDSENGRLFDQDNISTDTIVRRNDYSGESYSQEFRLQSTGDNRLDWTVGALYAKDKIEQFNTIRAGAEGSYTDPDTGEVIGLLPPIPAGFRINENNWVFETRSIAFFADTTWNATDKLALTVGARYTKDKIENATFGVVAFESPVDPTSASSDFTDASPRVVLRYMPSENITTFLSASSGYKAGGVDSVEGETIPFDEEKLWNYEAGIKTLLADGRVRLNASVFFIDWKDLQVQANFLLDPDDISSGTERTLNAAKASSKGAELELQAQITDNWSAGLGLGYLDAEFDDFKDAIIQGQIADLSGERLPRTPKITANGYLEYGRDLTGKLNGFVRTEWVHRSETPGDLEGVAREELGLPKFPYEIPAYDVVNLRLGISGETWDLLGSVENLFEEEYYNATADNFGLGGIRLKPHPRMWNLRFTYHTR